MSANAYSSALLISKKGWNTILKATLIAGILDITAALVMFYLKTKKSPVLVLKYITSAIIGKSAYSDGLLMPLLGLLLHFIIAFIWATIFFLLYPKIISLLKNSVVAGLLYGVVVWLVMNLLVLPITQVPKSPFNLPQALTGMLVLMLAIGLPIALIVDTYYRRDKVTLS